MTRVKAAAVTVAVLGGILLPVLPAVAASTGCVLNENLVSDGYSGPGLGGEILRVTTSGQSTLTTNTAPVGAPDLDEPLDMAFLASGNIVVADGSGPPQLVEVDRNTGVRTPLSSATRGTGPALYWPHSVVLEAAGTLLVGDENPTTWAPRILRVDPATGDRRILSGNGVAGGPAFVLAPLTLAVIGGVIYAANGENLLSIDPVTGLRTPLSGSGTGSGPTIVSPTSLAASSVPNSVVVLDMLQPGTTGGTFVGGLIRIDVGSGVRTRLSVNGTPLGGARYDAPVDMAYDACEDAYYVLENGYSPSTPPGRVYKVDGVTGAKSVYTEFTGAQNWSILRRPLIVLPGGTNGPHQTLGGGGPTNGGPTGGPGGPTVTPNSPGGPATIDPPGGGHND